MPRSIDLAAEFRKLGVSEPSEALLDTAAHVIEEQFVLRAALIEAFNMTHSKIRKNRRRVNTAEKETSHE